MAKWGFFGRSSVKRGRTHIVLGWNMSGASSSTYPENLGSEGLLAAELRDRVCLFLFSCLFFCPSRYDARHRKPSRCVYALNLGGTGISPPDSFSYRIVLVFVFVLVPPTKIPLSPGTQQVVTYSIAAVAGNWTILVFSARQHAERAICYRKSVRLSVCLSVRPSVCHTGGSVKNGWTYHRNSFTIW